MDVLEQMYGVRYMMCQSIINILGWLACSDATMTVAERQLLLRVVEHIGEEKVGGFVKANVSRWSPPSEDDCRRVKRLSDSQTRWLMETAIQVAVCDGPVNDPEKHILMFLADLNQYPPGEFEELFKRVAGAPFPPVEDSGTIEYWTRRDGKGKEDDHSRWNGQSRAGASSKAGRSTEEQQSQSRTGQTQDNWDNSRTMDRTKALAILGLADGATLEDIRTAHRRLTRIHHPDKFASLGSEAIATATATFKQIQTAYETLVGT